MVRRFFTLISRIAADLDRPARVLLLGVAIVHAIGIGWGLPASDGWDVDGVSPRDFLPGVLKTFTPGDYFTYPPLHLLLLTVLTLPVTLIALARAPSLSQHDVVQAFLSVPVMTTFAYVARFVSLLMSLGIVLALGNMARVIFGPRARLWTMAVAGVEMAGTYYAHTTNLDVPALFWASLALLGLRARREERRAEAAPPRRRAGRVRHRNEGSGRTRSSSSRSRACSSPGRWSGAAPERRASSFARPRSSS